MPGNPQPYLYRFDNLKHLREQRRTDAVLRGRRSFGNEPSFPHRQILNELATTKEGNGVYRLSFWKTWDDALLNLWSHHVGCAAQRVPENHPALTAFKRDHDEYLENYAWIFWNAMPVDSARPNWSPVGIPHGDIEVLHPDGYWLPMGQIPCLSDATSDDWKTYYVNGYSSTTPIHTASTESIEVGITWVMLRQSVGQWTHLLNAPDILSQLVSAVAGDLGISPEAARWIYAVEYDDRIRAEEVFPRIFQPRERGLKGIINRLHGQKPPHEIVLNGDSRHLPDSEIETLYGAFHISEYLRRGRRWSYEHLLLSEQKYTASIL